MLKIVIAVAGNTPFNFTAVRAFTALEQPTFSLLNPTVYLSKISYFFLTRYLASELQGYHFYFFCQHLFLIFFKTPTFFSRRVFFISTTERRKY
jgi:hypothetical protein